MKVYYLVIIVLTLNACKKESETIDLINGPWTIERIEQNGSNIFDETTNGGIGSKFFINVKNEDFFIETDAYRKKFARGDIFIEEIDKKVIIKINKSDNPKLIGKYKVEIDTLRTHQNYTLVKLYMLSDKNTYITAIKNRVNRIL